MDYSIVEHLLRIRQEIGEVGQAQSELMARIAALDNRMSQVERCLVNLHNNANQSRNRSIWSDDERAAYANWLTEASEQDQGFPTLPVSGG